MELDEDVFDTDLFPTNDWKCPPVPVCLPDPATQTGPPPATDDCWISGNGRNPDLLGADYILQEMKVEAKECLFAWHPDCTFCVRGAGNADFCSGDSGSPMVCSTDNGGFVQRGVVSYGKFSSTEDRDRL